MKKKRTEMSLQNASKRDTVTLRGIVITIKWRGHTITCENALEAKQLIEGLEGREVRSASGSLQLTGTRFWSFVEALGTTQCNILRLLLSKGRVSAADLRTYCQVDSNQELAGVLSGISKQAAARDIPARMIFSIDNEYAGGERTKYYAIAPEFKVAAFENNWPPADEE